MGPLWWEGGSMALGTGHRGSPTSFHKMPPAEPRALARSPESHEDADPERESHQLRPHSSQGAGWSLALGLTL